MTTELIARARLAEKSCADQQFSETAAAFRSIIEDLVKEQELLNNRSIVDTSPLLHSH